MIGEYMNDDLVAEYGIPNDTMFTVAVYECTRVYGGPEEGGWWYDAGDIDTDYGVSRFNTEADAITYCHYLNQQLRIEDKFTSRRGTYWREANINDGPMAPESFPAERPRYE